tara:strand:- start:840 stop:1046 length:207 start_codon:yes stop_codon:yes gene_type:complete
MLNATQELASAKFRHKKREAKKPPDYYQCNEVSISKVKRITVAINIAKIMQENIKSCQNIFLWCDLKS